MSLPITLKYIVPGAFFNCFLRSDVHLPENLEYIGYDAFAGLNQIDPALTLPRNLIEIHSNLFNSTVPLGNQILNLIMLPTCSLRFLSLTYEYLHDPKRTQKIISLVYALSINNTIETLELDYNYLQNKHIHLIMEVLHKCPKLKTLSLNSNQFTSIDAFMIATKKQIRIQSLMIDKNEIFEKSDDSTKLDCKPFFELAKANPELSHFGNYSHCPPKLQHLLDLNKCGRVLIVGTKTTSNINISIWPHVFARIRNFLVENNNNFDSHDTSHEEKQKRRANVIYHLLHESPIVIYKNIIMPTGSLTFNNNDT